MRRRWDPELKLRSAQSVRVLGNAEDAYALSQTDIALGAGRSVKLADIGRVSDSYGEITSIAKSRNNIIFFVEFVIKCRNPKMTIFRQIFL